MRANRKRGALTSSPKIMVSCRFWEFAALEVYQWNLATRRKIGRKPRRGFPERRFRLLYPQTMTMRFVQSRSTRLGPGRQRQIRLRRYRSCRQARESRWP